MEKKRLIYEETIKVYECYDSDGKRHIREESIVKEYDESENTRHNPTIVESVRYLWQQKYIQVDF